MNKSLRNTIVFLFRVFVSVGLLGLFFSKIDLWDFWHAVKGADIFLLFLAVLVIVATRGLTYYRLQRLLIVSGIPVKFLEMARVGIMCDFGAYFMPGLIAADILRIAGFSHFTDCLKRSAAAVALERFFGIFSLFLVAGVSLIFVRDVFHHETLFYCVAVAIGGFLCMAALLVFFPHYIENISACIFHGNAIFRKIHTFVEAVISFSNTRSVLFQTMGICVLIQLLRCLSAYIVSRAFGVTVPLEYFILFVPIVFVAVMLPVSIGGHGVREGVFIYLFGLVGLAQIDALAISLVNALLGTLVSVPGGFLYMRYGMPKLKKSD